VRNLIVDTTAPVITTDFLNNSLWYETSNMTADFNFTDNLLLHAINITIDGITIFNITNLNVDNYSYDLNYNVTGLGVGKHDLFVEVADGHTAQKLLDGDAYNPVNGLFNDYAKYNIRSPYDNVNILVERKDKSLFDNWEIVEHVDRFSEVFTPAVARETQVFVVESDQKIYVINKPRLLRRYLAYHRRSLERLRIERRAK